ncbi:MAG TPA: alpha/beta fold hydrolase [Solirubrobacteraceae bacterium]|nr:alpha/beta fold hydrolase [Solirubrobacteraceae bacterium]
MAGRTIGESPGGDLRVIALHGHDVACRVAGEGPALVLLHGIASDSGIWSAVLPGLAERHTVIAPDLPGHGMSDKPRGDYSLGALACGVRDLLAALGVERASLVGHSLGGGVAMQLAYQFPERVERLVLVSSGGLGREVHALLRAATLPGAEQALALLGRIGVLGAGAAAAGAVGRIGLRPSPDIAGIAESIATLADDGTRRAFLDTARAIIDPGGQRVGALDRLYLAAGMPTLILWGARDPLIPVSHAYAAHELMPHSSLEVFERAGHFPFRDDPVRFVTALSDFVASTAPADRDEASLRELLLAGGGTGT